MTLVKIETRNRLPSPECPFRILFCGYAFKMLICFGETSFIHIFSLIFQACITKWRSFTLYGMAMYGTVPFSLLPVTCINSPA